MTAAAEIRTTREMFNPERLGQSGAYFPGASPRNQPTYGATGRGRPRGQDAASQRYIDSLSTPASMAWDQPRPSFVSLSLAQAAPFSGPSPYTGVSSLDQGAVSAFGSMPDLARWNLAPGTDSFFNRNSSEPEDSPALSSHSSLNFLDLHPSIPVVEPEEPPISPFVSPSVLQNITSPYDAPMSWGEPDAARTTTLAANLPALADPMTSPYASPRSSLASPLEERSGYFPESDPLNVPDLQSGEIGDSVHPSKRVRVARGSMTASSTRSLPVQGGSDSGNATGSSAASTTGKSKPKLRTASRESKNAQHRPAETAEERKSRHSHNLVEKQYRNRLNSQFGNLLNALPERSRERSSGGRGETGGGDGD